MLSSKTKSNDKVSYPIFLRHRVERVSRESRNRQTEGRVFPIPGGVNNLSGETHTLEVLTSGHVGLVATRVVCRVQYP